LAHRLCRILFQRADFASPVLRSACVELVASMILTPVMDCFTPDYINGWMKAAIVGKDDEPAKEEESTDIPSQNHKPDENIAIGVNDSRPDMDRQPSYSMESHASTVDDLEDHFDLEETDYELEEELDVASGSFDDHENATEEVIMKSANPSRVMDSAEEILALLAMSLIELQAHIDFDEAREARESGEQLETRWNDQGCIETVRNLVLVIEAMLMHGVLLKRRKKKAILSPPSTLGASDPFSTNVDGDDDDMILRIRSKEYTSLTVMLMELTSDLETFENETIDSNEIIDVEMMYEEDIRDLRSIPRPKTGDLSTLRTLIAAWLHTGVVYRTLDALLCSSDSILHPFYHKDSFIRNKESVNDFLRLLRGLKNVDILVDTMTVLSHPPLDLHQIEDERKVNEAVDSGFFPATTSSVTKAAVPEFVHDNKKRVEIGPVSSGRLQIALKAKLKEQKKNNFGMGGSIKANLENNRKRLSRLVRPGEGRQSDSPHSKSFPSPRIGSFALPLANQNSSPLYLEFHRNDTLASSLRSERFERMKSFSNLNSDKSKKVHAEMICRSRVVSKDHFLQHRDLHNLAKGFYSNTTRLLLNHFNVDTAGGDGDNATHTLLTIENVTTRRKWAIPDDDSSFLLRAQPVHLNVVGVHRDQRSNNLSYKKYAAYFDEPVANVQKNEFRGARLRRQCFLRYYPNDRTAAINFIKSDRYLDGKLGRLIELETSGASKQIKEFERYLCNKSVREGSERSGNVLSNSILASTVMDSNDFTCVPRSGKAAEFVYRVSLFEEPEVELSGKRFIVQDASCLGMHRADASSLEISDASLTTSLLLGQTYDKRNKKQFHVKCDDKGVPILYFKIADHSADTDSPLSAQNRKNEDGGLRPYRLSFVRAALMVTSSRKEAQLQVSFNIVFTISYIMRWW